MMKRYEAPSMQIIDCMTDKEILTASEEAFDINVSFDSLWGMGI